MIKFLITRCFFLQSSLTPRDGGARFYTVLSQTDGHTHAHTIKEIKDTSPKEKFGSAECLYRRWLSSLVRARAIRFVWPTRIVVCTGNRWIPVQMTEHAPHRPPSADSCKFYYPPTTGRPPAHTRTSRDRPFFRASSRTPLSSPFFPPYIDGGSTNAWPSAYECYSRPTPFGGRSCATTTVFPFRENVWKIIFVIFFLLFVVFQEPSLPPPESSRFVAEFYGKR